MPTASRIAALAAAFIGVLGLVIIGCMPALALQNQAQTDWQQLRRQLIDASEALEAESYAEAELALRAAQTDLEGEPVPGDLDQLRVLIEASLDALQNADYAAALQTLQQAGRMVDEQQAAAPVGPGPPPTVLPDETPSRGIGGGGSRNGGNGSGVIKAARLFAGPGQYPPEAFAAYGIVAFRARASSGERERHVMLCEAYVAALPRSAELSVPVEEQMVTVWPIDNDKTADEMNTLTGTDICDQAVGRYGLPTALQAIGDAGEERLDRDRRGPFLLAWSPSDDKGDPEALMLIADLSDVTTYTQAEAFFVLWRTDIEGNPEYWNRGWDVERLRIAIQLWVDRYGSQIFSVLGG